MHLCVCVCVCVCVCEGIGIDVAHVYICIYVCMQEMDASEQARLLQRMLDSKDKALMQHAGICAFEVHVCIGGFLCLCFGLCVRYVSVNGAWVLSTPLSTSMVCIVPPLTLTAARKRGRQCPAAGRRIENAASA